MNIKNFTRAEIEEALRPIASLIGKSEKALQKLAPGTWQHTMLRDNLKALRIASSLMSQTSDADQFTREDLQEALRALASMIDRGEKAQVKFLPGTSQHTLQKNRSSALGIASELIGSALNSDHCVKNLH